MYGKGDIKMIDVTNVNQITKTMNQLFLAKINEKKYEKIWISHFYFVY